MIPVARQPEPATFATAVRSRGRTVNPPPPPVPSAFWRGKDHWRRALDDLNTACGRVCAFTGFYIERITGAPSVEHFQPKSRYPHLAYEWDNFRLICSRMNGRKADFEDVLDPFQIPPDTFSINPMSGEVIIGIGCPPALIAEAAQTIRRLKLNDGDCTALRREHATRYFNHHWSRAELQRQSPFVFHCLSQQGLL